MALLTLFSLALSPLLAAAAPGSAIHLRGQDDLRDVYDYIIVGAGTAGLTIGDRLSESGKYSVLAIEYGFLEPDGRRGTSNMYNITSVPQVHLKNREFWVGVGCIVGGSSAVNAQAFQRGTKLEYSHWDALSGIPNSGWDFEGLQPYFRKGIQLGAPPRPELTAIYNVTYNPSSYGTNTSKHSIFASFPEWHEPGVIPYYNAAKNFPGIELPIDGSVGSNGLWWQPRSEIPVVKTRSYSRTGHWDDLNRSDYHLITATRVDRVVFHGKTASGVEISARPLDSNSTLSTSSGNLKKKKRVIKARKEVILAAGAIHTPQILQQSGIGPAPLLREAKIPLLVNLPGVGSNLQDHAYHPGIVFNRPSSPSESFPLTTPTPIPNITIPNLPSGIPPPFGLNLLLIIGLPVTSPARFEALSDFYSAQDPSQYLPSGTDPTVLAGYARQHQLYTAALKSKQFSVLAMAVTNNSQAAPQLMHTFSRGTVKVNITHPFDAEPVVDYRFGSHPLDVELILENIKFVRRFFTSTDSELHKYGAREVSPGLEKYGTDEALREWIRENTVPSVFHPVGTAARMPREWGGVVDEGLQVYGVERLTVVDTSVWPTVVGGTTSQSVYAVAEKVRIFLFFFYMSIM
ncbi:putative GMC oxidoreductase [Cladorrhinum sp. PSN259]|nr:putative GMC oxidoreductase [Cladorrhinum sp. PSN259]